jgi:hypothetical protein
MVGIEKLEFENLFGVKKMKIGKIGIRNHQLHTRSLNKKN